MKLTQLFMDMLPTFGWLFLGFFLLITFFGILAIFFYKYRRRLTSNARILLFTINEDGNIIGGRFLWGKIDYDSKSKELACKDIEEVLSIEKVAPIQFGKNKYYLVTQYMDGTHKVVNPSVILTKDGKSYMDFDDQQLDYKRWFSYIVPHIYEMTHRDDLEKATKVAIWVIVGSICAGALIFGLSVWGSSKVLISAMVKALSLMTGWETIAGQFIQNVTVIP